MLRIHHPQNPHVEHLVMQAGPETVRIHHTADPGPSSIFSESNKRYLLAQGQEGPRDGRVTLGASKVSTIDREAITIRNYQGRIFVGGGDGSTV